MRLLLGNMPKRDGAELVGRYAYKRGRTTNDRPSGIECPYCHGQLVSRDYCDGRVVWADMNVPGDMAMVSIGPLPETHIALGCQVCKLSFTTLRSAAPCE